MRILPVIVGVAALCGLAFAPSAQAGCLKGAIVGGIAGKIVGHGYAGAAAGCAYGVHKDHKVERDRDMQQGRSVNHDRQ